MRFSICSYSFHRTAAAGDMDIFKYIDWNKEHGFSQLDPWMKHMELGYEDDAYIAKVKAAGDAAGLPFGCVAVDGGHIYEPTAEKRAANRKVAKRWIDICQQLDAEQVRIDAGGREETLDQIFDIVVEGYNELVAYARARGVEVIMENHWGPTKHPDNTVKVLDAVDGLGLLFDSNNWAEGTQEYAWEKCASYARLTHMKTFEFDAAGNDPTVDIAKCMNILRDVGYNGAWGIESCPRTISEIEGAEKTLALMKRISANW
ncbi:MAG: sugar phosphate isomerase/epimerase [Caldilineaceae bacterium]|nr:sugar phosphate isomerase/epimerase [Caldilineaceae bacterium]MCB0145754.1 sugar phosphate isomerase/epimerase [Caldilineaceae bacterium]MCB9150524.1 sugar phosphate isomerase/epimerase [Caldilineaceae bacterium]